MGVEPYGHHVDRVLTAVNSRDSALSAIATSWRRSFGFHHLDPAAPRRMHRLGESEFRLARERFGALLPIAAPTLDRLNAAVGGVGCCVLLADRDGVPVDRRGVAGDDTTFQDWGLWTGTVWSENAEGTNGIGTAIAEERPVTIDRDQHFFARNTGLSCTSAPIHDADGHLVAVLDVSSCRGDLMQGFLTLIGQSVVDAARRIEGDLFRHAFPTSRILLAPSDTPRLDGLIAVDADDLIVGATRAARQILGLPPADCGRPVPLADVDPRGSGRTSGDLLAAERGAVQRALVRAGGNVSAAAQALGISRATLHRKLVKLGLRHAVMAN